MSVEDLQNKLNAADQKFLKDVGRNLITASPPTLLGYLLPSLHPAIGAAIGGLLSGWGIWDAIKDRNAARRLVRESNSAVSFMIKIKKQLS
jgi:hypothetical protein